MFHAIINVSLDFRLMLKNVEELGAYAFAGGNVSVKPCGKQFGCFVKKLNINLLYDLALLCRWPPGKHLSRQKTCTLGGIIHNVALS